MKATATPLHPNPRDIRPSPTWADAVEQGRQIVVLRLTEQNLPGLSVAVGVGGDISAGWHPSVDCDHLWLKG